MLTEENSLKALSQHRAVQFVLDYTGGGWEPEPGGGMVFSTRSGEPFARVTTSYSLLRLATLCRALQREGGTVWRS